MWLQKILRSRRRRCEAFHSICPRKRCVNKKTTGIICLVAVIGLANTWLSAADPADSHPDLHLIPWPKVLTLATGHMPLAENCRIIASNAELKPLADVLAAEIELLTGLRMPVASGPGRAGDIVLVINQSIQAAEPILVLRDGNPVRTREGAHAIVIGDRATVEGFDYRATAEGTATLLQLLGKSASGYRFPKLEINDWPHADYCGVLLDVARQDHPAKPTNKF